MAGPVIQGFLVGSSLRVPGALDRRPAGTRARSALARLRGSPGTGAAPLRAGPSGGGPSARGHGLQGSRPVQRQGAVTPCHPAATAALP